MAIESEMDRQGADTRASLSANGEPAGAVARSARSTGGLLMLGMGASHAVARMVAPLYRDAGIEALAVPLSEYLTAPLPGGGHTVLLTSQSGESAEIRRWIETTADRTHSFGLTLEADSTLGRTLPSLVGAGGAEHAFAATRSVMVSLGLHLAVLEALGSDPAPALAALDLPATGLDGAALRVFDDVRAVVATGRRLQGLAEAIALGIMELARMPAFAMDGGQLRHGPPEMLGAEVGVVVFREDEADGERIAGTIDMARRAGAPVFVFDSSGRMTDEAGTHRLPRAHGAAALLSILPPAQRFMLDLAARRVRDVGTPVRSSKITATE